MFCTVGAYSEKADLDWPFASSKLSLIVDTNLHDLFVIVRKRICLKKKVYFIEEAQSFLTL